MLKHPTSTITHGDTPTVQTVEMTRNIEYTSAGGKTSWTRNRRTEGKTLVFMKAIVVVVDGIKRKPRIRI
jgi:hypothetical protein